MMASTSPIQGPVAAVVGDLVESRRHGDQRALFNAIKGTLDQVNHEIQPVQPLQMTIGDEFQAAYGTVADALDACLMIRLRLAATCDVRFGIGWGEITEYDRSLAPMAQSGTAWWNAREALDIVAKNVSLQDWPRGLRTWIIGEKSQTDATYNAFLLCRDELLSAMDDRDSHVTLGLMLGHRQVDIAKELGISQPSVSNRKQESGAAAILRAHQLLKEAAR